MKARIIITIFVLTFVFGLSTLTFSAEGDLSLSDKEIIEKLARLEEGQKGLNKRIDDLGKRMDDLGKRMDDLSARLDDGQKALNKRIDDLRSLTYVVLAGIIALIGFVIWDRRSALSPVITKTKELEERDDLTFRVLKEYARKEPKLAEVMRNLGLL